MTCIYRGAKAVVSALIVALIGSSVGLEWCAARLTVLQKFLANRIKRRGVLK